MNTPTVVAFYHAPPMHIDVGRLKWFNKLGNEQIRDIVAQSKVIANQCFNDYLQHYPSLVISGSKDNAVFLIWEVAFQVGKSKYKTVLMSYLMNSPADNPEATHPLLIIRMALTDWRNPALKSFLSHLNLYGPRLPGHHMFSADMNNSPGLYFVGAIENMHQGQSMREIHHEDIPG